jgi:hypothetical protein
MAGSSTMFSAQPSGGHPENKNHWSYLRYAQGVIYASIQQNLQPQIEPAIMV